MRLINALKGQNKGRPPVWMMRQAGRYLPEYRHLRAQHSLRDLFLTPDLAAEITKMPIDLIGMDAAILFADITLIALSLGFSLEFQEGPKTAGELQVRDVEESLQPVFEAIRLVKPQLKVPLLGFCGAPFTVATYMHREVDLDLLTDQTITYLQLQEKAGVDAIQIFDSAGHTLSREEYVTKSLPYIKRLVEAVKVPVILFMRSTHTRVDELVSLNPAAISFDWESSLHEMRKKVPMAVQGNLNPEFLYQPLSEVKRQTQALLDSMRGDKGFIVNLGHGVKPDAPVEAVRCFVDTVKAM